MRYEANMRHALHVGRSFAGSSSISALQEGCTHRESPSFVHLISSPEHGGVKPSASLCSTFLNTPHSSESGSLSQMASFKTATAMAETILISVSPWQVVDNERGIALFDCAF